jgi:hypothetical protein
MGGKQAKGWQPEKSKHKEENLSLLHFFFSPLPTTLGREEQELSYFFRSFITSSNFIMSLLLSNSFPLEILWISFLKNSNGGQNHRRQFNILFRKTNRQKQEMK